MEDLEEKDKKTILVVDDEKSIMELLVFNLQKEGYNTLEAYDGVTAVEMAMNEKPDLILLDVMLPKLDGISVCKKIRYALNISNIPILMISAKDTESDKIVGLEMGADDYITKPFQIREVMARIKANLRKAELNANLDVNAQKNEDKKDIIKVGDLTLDLKKVEARVKGEVINLTKKEFDVLKYLASQPGQVVTREMLLRDVWEYEEYVGATGSAATGTLDQMNQEYAESLAGRTQKLNTTLEGLFNDVFTTDMVYPLIDALTKLADAVDTLFKSVGGGPTIILGLASAFTRLFSNNIAEQINNAAMNKAVQQQRIENSQNRGALLEQLKVANPDESNQNTQAIINYAQRINELAPNLSSEQ